MNNQKIFISIIWGYYSAYYDYSANGNYHFHILKVAQELGYTVKVIVKEDGDSIEHDPNFIKNKIEIIKYRSFFRYLKNLIKYRKSIFYVNTFVWRSFLVPFFTRNAIFMGHHTVVRKNKLKQLVQDIVFKFFSKIRVISKDEKDFLVSRGIAEKKIYVIPMVVDEEEFVFQPASEKNKLIYCGRITPVKNIKTILEALAILNKQAENFILDIIGLIEDVDFENYLDKFGVRDKVNYLGYIPHNQLSYYLNQYKICVNSSINEGQCLAVYEAASSGCALCLPKILSFKEFKGMALFHDVFDADQLSKNIIKYITNEDLRNRDNQKIRKIIRDDYNSTAIEAKLSLMINDFVRS